MSARREVIVLEPSGRISREGFCSRPVPCPYCNGRGGFRVAVAGGHSVEGCPDCGGSGEVVAIVTIEWKPNKPDMI